MCSIGDAIYGVPWVLETRALFYNKALMARARLDSTRPPETWEEFSRAAAAVQRLGRGVHGCGVPAGGRSVIAKTLLPFLWGNGGRVLSRDLRRAVLDSARNVEALEFYLGLRAVGTMGPQEALEREFKGGRLGFLIAGPRLCREIQRESPGLRYGVAQVPRPSGERGEHVCWAEGEVLASFNASRRKHEAIELARFLVRPDHALAVAAAAGSVVPATLGADTSAYFRARPGERMMVRQLETARFAPNHPAWSEMEAAIEDETEHALHDRKNAADAVRDAQVRLAELLGRR
jgi:multiple sugar transport system substrate-binding protein